MPNKKDILIVDDDKNVCEILKEYCNQLKIFNKIYISYDGADAISKMHQHTFGLIILDMNMPKKTGLDVIKEEVIGQNTIKKENILVLSGNLDPATVSRLIQSGLINFMSKPIDEVQFKDKIKKMAN